MGLKLCSVISLLSGILTAFYAFKYSSILSLNNKLLKNQLIQFTNNYDISSLDKSMQIYGGSSSEGNWILRRWGSVHENSPWPNACNLICYMFMCNYELFIFGISILFYCFLFCFSGLHVLSCTHNVQ